MQRFTALGDGTFYKAQWLVKNPALPFERDQRAIKARDLYLECGTLESAGVAMGVTRERVRQLIAQGIRKGLFEKPYRRELDVAVEPLIEALAHGETFAKLAKDNGCSVGALKEFIWSNKPKGFTWEKLAEMVRRYQIIDEYLAMVKRLGHHPTTTEMFRSSRQSRALHARLIRSWPSMEVFRLENGFPHVPQGNPRFREDMQKGLAARRARQALRRKHIRDEILARVAVGEVGISEFHEAVTCSDILLRRIVGQLEAEGKIVAKRVGLKVYYRINKAGGNDDSGA